jgi:Lon protease-like protein
VPLFPLPNYWLFPGRNELLHVFEPRYVRMVEDCLDRAGRIVIGTVAEGHEYELPGSPPVYACAGLGEIRWHERMADGRRFMILLGGLARVGLCEVPSPHPYRLVEANVLETLPASAADTQRLRPRLVQALLEHAPAAAQDLEQLGVGELADQLVLRLGLPHRCMQALFAELDPAVRASIALDAHERRAK